MLIITTLSLLMAATMGWMALRLLRDEQRRSEARVAALSAALDTPWTAPAAPPPAHDWRVAPAPAAASAPLAPPAPPVPGVAPVALSLEGPQMVALDDTHPEEYFAPQVPAPVTDTATVRMPLEAPPAPDAPATAATGDATADRPMFGADQTAVPASDDRHWLAVAAVAIVALGLGGLWWTTSGTSVAASPSASVASAPATGGVPVELTSLGHERTDAGLVVRGLVRNPPAGSARIGTTASVFLFDETGGFLGSGRGVLDTSTLTAGDEAGFEVTLPGHTKVRRYRVTFRAPDGTVVPHLDKRVVTQAGASS